MKKLQKYWAKSLWFFQGIWVKLAVTGLRNKEPCSKKEGIWVHWGFGYYKWRKEEALILYSEPENKNEIC